MLNNEIKNLYNICKKLQDTNSRIEKENILYNEKNNKDFTNLIYFLFNPFITTGINLKKLKKSIKENDNCYIYNFNSLQELLNYIQIHNTGKDENIKNIQYFINQLEEPLNSFVELIITKSLKLGIDKKTINKIYGNNFIRSFDVMLGVSIEHCKLPNNIWFSISQKLNGCRCIYYKHKLYTRQGKEYTGLQHIISDIEYLIALNILPKNVVLDGELILKYKNNLSDSEAFQVSVGIANSKSEKKEELKLTIFDILTEKEFEQGYSYSTYMGRKKKLLNIKDFNPKLNNIDIVKFFYEGTDQNQIWKYLDYAEQNDMEGLMINLNTPYICERTKNLIKVKKFYTYDLEIIDIEEGRGKLKGTLGSFIVKYKNNTINVGSGLTDKQRKEYWNNKDNLIGKIIEVKYKEKTIDKNTGLESLQFPIFVSLRLDKKESSYE